MGHPARRGSLATRVQEAIIELAPPPAIYVTLDERRPPRPSMIDELAAIVIEATRNAHRHSGSSTVRVHGWVDFERGRVVVEDRGSGFEVDAAYPGHFGLTGMRERAAKVSAALSVVSNSEGTTVAVEWGDR